MDYELYCKDIEKRATDMYKKRYANHYRLKGVQFMVDVDRNNYEFGGESQIDNSVLKMKLYKGTIDNLVDYTYEIMRIKTSNDLKAIVAKSSKNVISAEGIYFEDGIPKAFDTKNRDLDITRIIVVFVYRFIICHEFGHLFRGHFEHFFNCARNNMGFIPMEFSGCISRDMLDQSKKDIYTMEWDADCFASIESMRELLFLYGNYDTQVKKPDRSVPKELFLWWGYSVAILLHKIQALYFEEYEKRNIIYTPIVRMRNITNSALEALDIITDGLYSIDEINEMKRLISKGVILAEELIIHYEKTDYGWSNNSEEDIREALSILINNWDMLKNVLKNSAFFDLEDISPEGNL